MCWSITRSICLGWEDLIDGIDKPLVVDGFAPVPEAPGLGFGDLNEEAIRERMDPTRDAGYFEPTAAWDDERSRDRLWS